jgi:hypothetical protein
MAWTLGTLERVDGVSGRDLVADLEARRASQADRRVPSSDLAFRTSGGAISLELPRGTHPLTAAAAMEVRRRAGLPVRSAARDEEFRLNEWKDSAGEHLVRFEEDRVRAVLPARIPVVDNPDLLGVLLRALAKVRVEVKVEECVEQDGDLTLTLVAPELAREVGAGDMVYGGLYLASSETSLLDTEACARIFRVACANGAIVDHGEGRRMVLAKTGECGDWARRLEQVVAKSFEGGTMDEEAARLRRTLDEMLASPYELLVNLRAQGLVTDEEQARIQTEFRRADDLTLHGFINAVTRVAHVHFRAGGRRFDLERLAGEILGGDHLPPAGVPSWAG